jgi:chromosome segregation ATPase
MVCLYKLIEVLAENTRVKYAGWDDTYGELRETRAQLSEARDDIFVNKEQLTEANKKIAELTDTATGLRTQGLASRAYISRLQDWGRAMQREAVRQYDVSKKVNEFYGDFYEFLPPKEGQRLDAMPP